MGGCNLCHPFARCDAITVTWTPTIVYWDATLIIVKYKWIEILKSKWNVSHKHICSYAALLVILCSLYPRPAGFFSNSIFLYLLLSFLWRCGPMRAMALVLRFLDHTQRRTTIGRTPVGEWSARRRDLYLTTHNTHIRQISMPPLGFEPTISSGERPQTYALDRAGTGTGSLFLYNRKKISAEYWSCLISFADLPVKEFENRWTIQLKSRFF